MIASRAAGSGAGPSLGSTTVSRYWVIWILLGSAPASCRLLTPCTNVRRPDRQVRKRISAVLQTFLQVPVAARCLLRGDPSDLRHEQLADPGSLELQGERHPRGCAASQRFDRDASVGPDRSLDTADRPAARRGDLGDLLDLREFRTGDPARGDHARTDLAWAPRLDPCADDV